MGLLFSNGLIYSTWGVSVPILKSKFGLSEGTLSLAMAGLALGGIATMGQVGRWISRIGSDRASAWTAVFMALLAAPILLVPNYAALLPLLVFYGVATAANDVSANAQGSYLEALSQRSLIGSFHASFSIGGLAGSVLASNWSFTHLPEAANFYLLSLLVAMTAGLSSRFLIRDAGPPNFTGGSPTAQVGEEIPMAVRKRLRVFGALAFAALVVEGAFYDWAAVYMREVISAPDSWIGYGYAAFAIGMTTGRLSGDWIRDRLKHQVVMSGSGVLGALGLFLVISASSGLVAIIGFGVTGLGVANVIPILFSSAGKLTQAAGVAASQGLAVTTRIAYVGLLVGPLFIGPVAQCLGLRSSLFILTIAIVAICTGWLWLSHISGGTPWAPPTAPSNALSPTELRKV
ncbi:UNVERIFIED_ORG: putative MFS family arabinose efflux permease [Variovorax paradoxus]|nr:putative MFS family arabinose efflux permease [Variovorax paradoxus]